MELGLVKNNILVIGIYMFFMSCSQVNTIEMYTKHKNQIDTLCLKAKVFRDKLPYKNISHSYERDNVFMLRIEIGNSVYENFYFSENGSFLVQKTKELMLNKNTESKNVNVIISILEKENIKEIIYTVNAINVKGFSTTEDSFFVSFGEKGKKLTNPDITRGLLFTENIKYKQHINYVEQVDKNLYLYETVL